MESRLHIHYFYYIDKDMRANNFCFLVLIIFTSCLKVCAQKYNSTNCGAVAHNLLYINENPSLKNTLNVLDQKYYKSIKKEKSSRNGHVSLPIVVHIIHNNGIENISDAQIYQAIRDLNDAFANLDYYDQGIGVDADIEFCLAQRNESGEFTTGIVRYQSPYTDMSLSGSAQEIQDLATWDREKYINVRVVSNSCIAGNCDVIGFGGLGYGITMDAEYFGTSQVKSSVISHEMGHALGLYHTFHQGCKNDDCLADGDKVCDTPPDNHINEHCFTSYNSCTTDADDLSTNNPFRSISNGGIGDQVDDHNNYLDYNWLECRNHFTQGQKDRMHFYIDNFYNSLLTAKSCLVPCEEIPTANFTPLPNTIDIGSEITFVSESMNAFQYFWILDGDTLAYDENISINFNEEGLHSLSLVAFNEHIECDTSVFSLDINVACPVFANFDYMINDGILSFTDQSTSNDSVNWIISNSNGDILFASINSEENFDASNVDFIQLCLTSSNEYCNDQYCEYISFAPNDTEICNNEADDDNDGLIDLFDPDCPCQNEVYQAHCPVECEYIPDSFPEFSMQLKWKSDVVNNVSYGTNFLVGDVDNNGSIEICVLDAQYANPPFFDPTGGIKFLNGVDGITNNYFEFGLDQLGGIMCMADIDRNGQAEIYLTVGGKFSKLSNDFNLIFQNDFDNLSYYQSIITADLNSDGTAEIIKGSDVFNGESGEILLDHPSGGCNHTFSGSPSACGLNFSAVGDLLSSPGLEIASGNVVYDLDLTNQSDSVGNTSTMIIADSEVMDGFTSLGDIDGDGALDVIVVRGDNIGDGGVWVWNPRTGNIIASGPSGDDGGVAFIGDVDGDCLPEIGMTFEYELRMYKYDGTPDLKLLWSLATNDETGKTGMTMFDFNQDGRVEVVYRDESQLRIINGFDGNILTSYPVSSGTWLENPIISDVDSDGQADIIVPGDLGDGLGDRILCFESGTSPWAPSRSVWNQYGYNPTMINDDLTVPRNPQNSAHPLQGTENCLQETCATPYNNYMVQATYRTQEGCFVWPDAENNLDIGLETDINCFVDSIELCIYLDVSDPSILDAGISLITYEESISPHIYIVDEIIYTDTFCTKISVDILTSLSLITFVNASNSSYPPNFDDPILSECDFENNIDTIQSNVATISCNYPIVYDLDSICPITIVTDSIVDEYNCTVDFEMEISYIENNQVVILDTNVIFEPGIYKVEIFTVFGNSCWTEVEILETENPQLDLGPDIITTCIFEPITLTAPSGFDSYLWNDFTTDSIFTAALPGIYTLETTYGCGSTVRDTVIITIDSTSGVDILQDAMTICAGESITLNIQNLQDSVRWFPEENVDCVSCASVEVQVDTTTTFFVTGFLAGCLSIDTVTITINPVVQDVQIETLCDGDSILFYGVYLKNEDVYEHITDDCDSIITLFLEVEEVYTGSITDTICYGDSIQIGTEYFGIPDDYVISFVAQNGCDSTILLTLNNYPENIFYDTLQICDGDSILIENTWVNSSDIYEINSISLEGCDSTTYLNLKLVERIEEEEHLTICQGDSILFDLDWISDEGSFTKDFISKSGCDSTFTYHISLSIPDVKNDTLRICPGDSVLIGDAWLSVEGTEIFTYQNIEGCDSIITINLLFDDVIMSSSDEMICLGDTLYTSDTMIVNTGVYIFSGVSNGGCDSIHTLTVTNAKVPSINLQDTIVSSGDVLIISIPIDTSLYFIEWIGLLETSCTNCPQISITAVENLEITLIVTEKITGCFTEESYTITIEQSIPELHIPNIFSPNDDGLNDFWTVDFSKFPINETIIFDRWGNKVGYWKNIDHVSWNGRINSQAAEQGVYIFMIRYQDEKDNMISKIGDVTILR